MFWSKFNESFEVINFRCSEKANEITNGNAKMVGRLLWEMRAAEEKIASEMKWVKSRTERIENALESGSYFNSAGEYQSCASDCDRAIVQLATLETVLKSLIDESTREFAQKVNEIASELK